MNKIIRQKVLQVSKHNASFTFDDLNEIVFCVFRYNVNFFRLQFSKNTKDIFAFEIFELYKSESLKFTLSIFAPLKLVWRISEFLKDILVKQEAPKEQN